LGQICSASIGLPILLLSKTFFHQDLAIIRLCERFNKILMKFIAILLDCTSKRACEVLVYKICTAREVFVSSKALSIVGKQVRSRFSCAENIIYTAEEKKRAKHCTYIVVQKYQ
jgi:hypothetical protein